MSKTPELALAKNHIEAGNYARAKRLIERILRPGADNSEALQLLGNIEVFRGRPGLAIPYFRKSLDLDDSRADVWASLGWCYQTLRKTDRAVKAFKKALALEAGHYEARAGLGATLILLGRVKEAQGHLEAAIARSDKNLEPYRLLAAFTNKGKEKAFLKGMLDLEKRCEKYPVSEQVQLTFALASAFDKQGDKENFLKSMEKANALQRRSAPDWYPPNKAMCDLSREVFTAEFCKKTNPPGLKKITPILIVGMPRAGASLVEQILASHGEIFGGGELPAIRQIVVEEPMQGRQEIYPAFVPELSDEELSAMAARYQAKVVSLAGQHGYITDKMPGNEYFLGMIHKIMPWARVIHIRRHPCDTALSIYSRYFDGALPFTSSLTSLAKYFRLSHTYMEHWKAVLPGFALDIKYEDLVADIEATTRKMLKFCGLEWDPACLEYYRNKRPVHTHSAAQVRQKIYTSSIGRWQDYKKTLQPFISGIEDIIEAYGYPRPATRDQNYGNHQGNS
ncbi:MAG: sulfotransferase [Proteobacteria bacterium]|nr:sulfotransferase [Pseudomonadota bacterium]